MLLRKPREFLKFTGDARRLRRLLWRAVKEGRIKDRFEVDEFLNLVACSQEDAQEVQKIIDEIKPRWED